METKKRTAAEACQNFSDKLVTLLAVISAFVCAGLMEDFTMHSFIVIYWAVLTVKNVTDRIKRLIERGKPREK